MFLSHCVKTMSNGGILSTQHNAPCDSNRKLKKISTSLFLICFLETHNANREVIIDDFIWNWVAFLLILICDDLHTPAVHPHLRAPLDVFKNTTQILTVISLQKAKHTKTIMTHCFVCAILEKCIWRTSLLLNHNQVQTNTRTATEHKQNNVSTVRKLSNSYFSPPPHRRHRARSFPVPKGSTATGGRTSRFALSDDKKVQINCVAMIFTEVNGTKVMCAFYSTWSNDLTYCVKNPAHSSISPTHQDPVIL